MTCHVRCFSPDVTVIVVKLSMKVGLGLLNSFTLVKSMTIQASVGLGLHHLKLKVIKSVSMILCSSERRWLKIAYTLKRGRWVVFDLPTKWGYIQ